MTPMALAWLRTHWQHVAGLAGGLILVLPFLAGAVGGSESVFVSVNAPEADDSIQVFVGKETGLIGGCPDEAHVEIFRDEIPVYPRVLGEIDLDDCQGAIEIPYRKFASKNGRYLASVDVGDQTAETRFSVEKVVDWVFIRSFPNQTEERTRVEVAFSRIQGQPIRSSVFASGELVLDVYWESCKSDGPLGMGLGLTNQTEDCQANHDNVFHGTVPIDTSAVTHVIIPWSNFESDKYEEDRPAEGAYNVTATFHNEHAKANLNVPMDPTVYREDPPGNWFEVEYE